MKILLLDMGSYALNCLLAKHAGHEIRMTYDLPEGVLEENDMFRFDLWTPPDHGIQSPIERVPMDRIWDSRPDIVWAEDQSPGFVSGARMRIGPKAVFGPDASMWQLAHDRMTLRYMLRYTPQESDKMRLCVPETYAYRNATEALDDTVLGRSGHHNLRGRQVLRIGTPQDAATAKDRTFVPYTAADTHHMLRHLQDIYGENKGPQITAQRYIKGLEVAFSAFFDGEEFRLPLCTNFEYKDYFSPPSGAMSGEVGTLLWLDSSKAAYDTEQWRALETVARLLRTRCVEYKGIVDVNCILPDNSTQHLYVMEITARMGVPTANGYYMLWKSDFVRDLECLAHDPKVFEPDVSDDFSVSVTYNQIIDQGTRLVKEPYRGYVDGVAEASKHAFTAPLIAMRGTRGIRSVGDRTMCCTAVHENPTVARERAYAAVSELRCHSHSFRPDIANNEHLMRIVHCLGRARMITDERRGRILESLVGRR